MLGKIKKNILLILVFLGLIGSVFYFGNKKQGYHVDELYSYGLANSEYLPFLHFGDHPYMVKDWMNEYGPGENLVQFCKNLVKDYQILKECGFSFRSSVIYQDYLRAQSNSSDTDSTTWMDGQEYRDYLMASKNNRFNYASVYYNQRGDVHPPLFYMLLHTVCSLFQGSFSKWFGLILNAIYLLIALYLWYVTIREHLGGEQLARMNLVLWGLSCGFMTCVLLIRMYALLTLICVAYFRIHLQIADNGFEMGKKELKKVGLIVFLGFYTHYYFIIYALFLAIVFVVWMGTQKKCKSIGRYILTLALAAIVGLCIWPFAIKHVFRGYRGTESLSKLSSGSFYWTKIKLMGEYVFLHMLGCKYWIMIAVGILLGGGLILKKAKGIAWGKVAMVLIPPAIYLICVSQIVPMFAERYVMCCFPFFGLALTGCVWYGWRAICERIQGREHAFRIPIEALGLCVMTVILLLCGSFFVQTPGYLSGGQETIEVPEKTDCVYILPDGTWNESAFHTNVLAKSDRVGVSFYSSMERLNPDGEYQPNDYVYVFIQKEMDTEMVLQRVKELLGLSEKKEVFRDVDQVAVRILLQ